jgi:hypothetical protein
MLEKRISQLAEGDQAWLKMVKDDGRIHGVTNPMGTTTSSAVHMAPNLGLVVSRKKPFGKESHARVRSLQLPQLRLARQRSFALGAGGLRSVGADPSSRRIGSSAGALLFRPSVLRKRALRYTGHYEHTDNLTDANSGA